MLSCDTILEQPFPRLISNRIARRAQDRISSNDREQHSTTLIEIISVTEPIRVSVKPRGDQRTYPRQNVNKASLLGESFSNCTNESTGLCLCKITIPQSVKINHSLLFSVTCVTNSFNPAFPIINAASSPSEVSSQIARAVPVKFNEPAISGGGGVLYEEG